MKWAVIALGILAILSVAWAGIVTLGVGMSTAPRFRVPDLILGMSPALLSALLAGAGAHYSRKVASRRPYFLTFVVILVLSLATLAYLLVIYIDMN